MSCRGCLGALCELGYSCAGVPGSPGKFETKNAMNRHVPTVEGAVAPSAPRPRSFCGVAMCASVAGLPLCFWGA